MDKSQKNILLLIIVVIIISLMIGAAFYYIKHQQKIKLNQESKNYFEIKELNIKFEVSDEIKDLTYSVKDGAAYGYQYKTAILSSVSLAKIGKYCGLDIEGETPLGTITVTEKSLSQIGVETGYTSLYESSNFNVAYESPLSFCGESRESADLATKQLNALNNSLKTIQLISDPSSFEFSFCKITPHAGAKPTLDEGEFDLGESVVCNFQVNSDLPNFTFKFISGGEISEGNEIITIQIFKNNKFLQTINSDQWSQFGPYYEESFYPDIFELKDINSDGFKDMVVYDTGLTGNAGQFYDTWVYNSQKGIFEEGSGLFIPN